MNRRERFDRLEEAAIDASSIIYMLKAGFLGLLASTITLKSVPEVVGETGWPSLPITVVSTEGSTRSEPRIRSPEGTPAPGVDEITGAPGEPIQSNDQRLLAFAEEAALPVISEDRAILRAAEEAGLDYYNSLMMLAFLRYRGRLNLQWYEEAKDRLLEVARYGRDVLQLFEEIEAELSRPS
ncbi:MAG: hypothetical protein ACLFNP_01340 [Spirochaetaceae bacterium]